MGAPGLPRQPGRPACSPQGQPHCRVTWMRCSGIWSRAVLRGLGFLSLVTLSVSQGDPPPPPPPPDPCHGNTCHGHGTCDGSSGSAVCTCNDGWAPPSCDRCSHTCPAEAPTGHATACPAGQCLGGSCTSGCSSGYTKSGSGRYTCDADGDWSQGSLVCTPKACPAGPPVAHANSCAAGVYNGPACQATCEDGYEGTGSASYTCQDTGSWGGGNLVCEGRPCDGAPVLSGDLRVSEEHGGAPGHYPSTLTFSCAHGNERVGGDTVWVCSNQTLRYQPNTVPTARADEVVCSQCPAIASGHCPAEQLRCPVHLEPRGCCSGWGCMPWKKRCHAVQSPSTCNQCEAGYSQGSPSACNPEQCPPIDPTSDAVLDVSYQIDGHSQADAPLFSGTAAHPASLAKFSCAPNHILTNSLSAFVAKDSGQDTWACTVGADGRTLEWKPWRNNAFAQGVTGLPQCMPTCAANPCSSAEAGGVAAAHFSACFDNHGKQKFRCNYSHQVLIIQR